MDKQLSLDDVARYPRPGATIPRTITFTPDNKQVAYLFSAAGTLRQELWTYDIETGERRQATGTAPATEQVASQSLEEELRRERSRTREEGVTRYQYVRAGAEGRLTLLVPAKAGLLIARGDDVPEPLAGTEGAIEARLSPDGAHVAFVRDGDLYVAPTDGSAPPRRLTDGAGEGVTNGLAEYIAQEEMGRADGYWWSPDGARLAFEQADSRQIPLYQIVHQGTESVTVEEHHYPFAGGPNAIVRLGVVPIAGGSADVIWMDLGSNEDIYLARVAWRPDGTLTAQIESRDQRTLRLAAFDGQTGAATTLIEEHGEPWLNLADDTRFLASGEILWSSERTGFRHLYLYDRTGHEARTLTEGDWMVTGVVAVDGSRRIVYFGSTRDGVLERHLYAVSLDGGEVRRLTEGPGWHETVMSPDCRWFVDTWSSVELPPRVALHRTDDGAETDVLHENGEVSVEALGLLVPELTSFRTRDGVLLQAAVYASKETRTGGRPHPLVVSVYGGPHAQTVTNSWGLTIDLRAQYLAQRGFVVLKVDNRGSANRGLAFEGAIAGRMGHVEVEDQVDGVRFLATRPYVDGERVGIYGWSYGGYMTGRALLLAPDVFTAGVAGAPVTSWEGYDTHYTERYMGQPAANPEGYAASSALNAVEALRGRLLVVHGLVDENVHARHTMRLLTALTGASRQYELVLFPEERHMPRRPADLVYLERRIMEFLERHL